MPFEAAGNPILVTGATGHTGRRAAQRLLDCGARVRCMLHTPAHRNRLPQNDRMEIVYGSASNPPDLIKALEGVDTVVHLAHIRYAPVLVQVLSQLAASPSPEVAGLQLSSPARISSYRLIAMSSTRLLSRFPSETREAVRAGEKSIESAPPSVRWTILRASMIFGGPDDNNLERMGDWVAKRRMFPIFGDGKNLVQPVFVLDLVGAIVSCLERHESIGHTYTIAGPKAMTYEEMVVAVAKARGAKTPLFIHLPLEFSHRAIERITQLWPGCPLGPEMVQRFGEDKAFDISAAQRDLGYAPTAFSEALAKKFNRQV